MCSVSRWTYKITGLSCRICTAKKASTDAKFCEAKSWIRELKGVVEGILLSRGGRSTVGEYGGEKGSPLSAKEVLDLREEGVEFDEEYERRLAEGLLEGFSPVSSPVGEGFTGDVSTTSTSMEKTDVEDGELEEVDFRVVEDDSSHRLLLLPAIVRAKGGRLVRD